MANLQGYELTVTGRALLAKAGTGACTLNFTKVKLGADETSLNDLINKTDLVGTNIKQIDIVGSQANEATFTIIATVTNSGMQDNFLIRQVGIFAKGVAATNPGTGVTPENINETLFAVAYDTQPDIIPAESITPYTRQFNANMTVTNVEQCDVTLTPAGVVTVQVLNNHDDNSEAHGNLIKRIFGSASATMESVKTSVQNWCKESIASVFGVASATTDNIKSKVKEWALEKINEWIETLGIRYNIAQNGYICLGSLFGDAIIQWGLTAGTISTIHYSISYNIYFPNTSIMTIMPNSGKKEPVYYTGEWTSPGRYSFEVDFNTGCQYIFWIAIGY